MCLLIGSCLHCSVFLFLQRFKSLLPMTPTTLPQSSRTGAPDTRCRMGSTLDMGSVDPTASTFSFGVITSSTRESEDSSLDKASSRLYKTSCHSCGDTLSSSASSGRRRLMDAPAITSVSSEPVRSDGWAARGTPVLGVGVIVVIPPKRDTFPPLNSSTRECIFSFFCSTSFFVSYFSI